MNFEYNKNYVTRDTIIFGYPINWQSTSEWIAFEKLTIEQLQQLIEQKFIDLDQDYNGSPTIKQFRDFAVKQKSQGFDFTFDGDVVSPNNKDYGVYIDTINLDDSFTNELAQEFLNFVGDADIVSIGNTEYYELGVKVDNYLVANFSGLCAWWD